MEVVHGRGYVDSIQYHIVWYIKYRYKLISSGMESRFKQNSGEQWFSDTGIRYE